MDDVKQMCFVIISFYFSALEYYGVEIKQLCSSEIHIFCEMLMFKETVTQE